MHRRTLSTLVAVLVVAALTWEASAVAADEDAGCNCVAYVQSRAGLPVGPATAAGYRESTMQGFGYRRVPPDDAATDGAIMVWDAGQKGVRSDGHMALVEGRPAYDGTLWVLTVRHANWGGCGIRSDTFRWSELSGVAFYVPASRPGRRDAGWRGRVRMVAS
jgi:hypothetical protein